MTVFRLRWIALPLLVVLLTACSSPRMLLVQGVADQLAGQSRDVEDDLELVRESSAFYLKLSESVLRSVPGHLPLAEAVAGGFTRYAYAFVSFEAEKLESRDAQGAKRLRQRAAKLYGRAHRHAMAALEHHQPGFAQSLAAASMSNPTTLRIPAEQVGVAYWAAASWGAYIALSTDRPEAVADLPQAVRLATLAWQTEPTHGQGALASLMGSFEAGRPGGSRQQAERYFDQAVAAGDSRQAGPYVGKAESWAAPAGDRAAFEDLLRQALAAAARQPDLGNQVMRERAQWLLDTADDRF